MKLMLVAGEASGDTLGGALLADLRQRIPHLQAIGVGGAKMRAEGLQGVADVNDLSVIGLVEVFRCLPRLIRVFRRLVSLLRDESPDLLITIDFPDFNFLLARQAKAMGVRVVHYVSPQVWAWRQGRVHKISRWVDHLLVLFPFEPACYEGTGLAVDFVGHPLVERTKLAVSRHELRRRFGVGGEDRLVVLCPGSRHGEVKRLLGVMVETCQRLSQEGGLRFALALADTLTEADVRQYWPPGACPEIEILQGETYALLAAADVALVASGTATLETALLGTPMVVIYRVNTGSFWLGRMLIHVPWISLVNIVAGRELVPERIQGMANAAQLVQDVHRILYEPGVAQEMRHGFGELRDKLAPPERGAAAVVMELLSSPPSPVP